jgi:hypothetical protein
MAWQTALMVSIVFSVALTSGALLYCDIKSREIDEDEDE